MVARKAQRRIERRRRKKVGKLRRMPTDRRYVEHPRYGDRPIFSGENWTEAEIRQCYWRYGSERRLYAESAIRADLSRQSFCCAPRRVYVDVERRCRSCGRLFLWFALEQKYWFEVLGFFCDADCQHCQDCRHMAHVLRERRMAYDALLAKPDKTTAEWDRLAELGEALFAEGYIRKPETLLKSRMPKAMRRS